MLRWAISYKHVTLLLRISNIWFSPIRFWDQIQFWCTLLQGEIYITGLISICAHFSFMQVENPNTIQRTKKPSLVLRSPFNDRAVKITARANQVDKEMYYWVLNTKNDHEYVIRSVFLQSLYELKNITSYQNNVRNFTGKQQFIKTPMLRRPKKSLFLLHHLRKSLLR